MSRHADVPGAGAPTLVFLGGAGLPGWIWDEVRSQLDVTSVVVETPRGSSSLAEHAAAVLEQARSRRIVVVAHSIGGAVASELLASQADRVAGVLGVSAVVPAPGRSFVQTLPFPARAVLPLLLRVAGTRPPETAVRSSLGRGLPEATVDRLVTDLSPESRRLFTDRVSEGGGTGGQPRGYVCTTSDPELTVALQQRSAATLEAQWIETVDSGHLAPLEHPDVVVGAVERLLLDVS